MAQFHYGLPSRSLLPLGWLLPRLNHTMASSSISMRRPAMATVALAIRPHLPLRVFQLLFLPLLPWPPRFLAHRWLPSPPLCARIMPRSTPALQLHRFPTITATTTLASPLRLATPVPQPPARALPIRAPAASPPSRTMEGQGPFRFFLLSQRRPWGRLSATSTAPRPAEAVRVA